MKIKINTPLKAKIRNKRPPILRDIQELLFQHLEELFNALLEGRKERIKKNQQHFLDNKDLMILLRGKRRISFFQVQMMHSIFALQRSAKYKDKKKASCYLLLTHCLQLQPSHNNICMVSPSKKTQYQGLQIQVRGKNKIM